MFAQRLALSGRNRADVQTFGWKRLHKARIWRGVGATANFSPDWDRNRPMLARLRPTPNNVGAESAKLGPESSTLRNPQVGPTSTIFCPESAKNGPIWSGIVPVWPDVDQSWLDIGQSQHRSDSGSVLSRSRPTLARHRSQLAHLARSQPDFARHWPTSTNSGPTSASLFCHPGSRNDNHRGALTEAESCRFRRLPLCSPIFPAPSSRRGLASGLRALLASPPPRQPLCPPLSASFRFLF